ncbi:MAG: hypothetical protein DLM53_12330 [Candidatus Eremiobacter antarcticus]|nr:beta-lactamase family protein [Candidatus Eremiobacteraeota bacterium]MBC5808876.1 beta-lactamase family protein [Candidatus Eremiobacteraeota bacterium]PZR60439.1 MAG: hypothetical protein DLM53_12330 [Candidatus Eremiobacter sp. RRmetagenome_bin22]
MTQIRLLVAVVTAAVVIAWPLTLSGAAARPTSATRLSAAQTARVDAAVGKIVSSSLVPGAQLAIERRGAVVYERAYGVADAARKKAVNLRTRFEIGSITKQVTAAAVLQLVEAHRLNLDDPLEKYVPQYKPGAAVTLRQLMWQTTGIPDYTALPRFMHSTINTPGSFERILALIADKPLDFAPGTRWAYSDTNYILLGRVIEAASKMSYNEYIREHIFRAAGMSRTGTIADEGAMRDMATGYSSRNGRQGPTARFSDPWAWSAGNIVSTAADVLKWDDALFRGKLLSLQSVALMTTPGTLSDGTPTSYAMGWVVDTQDGHKRIWHNGGTVGFGSSNMLYPDDGLRIVALINDASIPPETLTARVFEALNPGLAAATDHAVAYEDPAVTPRAKDIMRGLRRVIYTRPL